MPFRKSSTFDITTNGFLKMRFPDSLSRNGIALCRKMPEW